MDDVPSDRRVSEVESLRGQLRDALAELRAALDACSALAERLELLERERDRQAVP